MSYPSGVTTRTITVGDSITVESGTDLAIRATLRSSRGLVWVATGERAVSSPEVRQRTGGGGVMFTPPVTDQAGWRDLATGSLIDVSAANSHTHTYTIELVTLQGTRPVDRRTIGPFPLPTGDGSPVDADLLIEADTVPGLLVSVPDSWSAQVASAQQAAQDAADVAAVAVDDYLTANPPPPNELAIGTVTTGAPGSAAAASISGAAPSQVLNLTIPTGATGAVSAWEYYAAGRPDIVGTLDPAALAWRNAAPSGSTFYSTDGPEGAWVWRKRGIVWTCVEGDTEPIDLTPKLNANWTVTLATWQRINNVVYLRIEGAQGTASGDIIAGLPNSLRCNGGTIEWRQGTGGSTVMRPANWYLSGKYIGGPQPGLGAASLINGVSCSLFAWPTTLTL